MECHHRSDDVSFLRQNHVMMHDVGICRRCGKQVWRVSHFQSQWLTSADQPAYVPTSFLKRMETK